MDAGDETNVTEIELMPDGRIFVFGMSVEVLEVLHQFQGRSDTKVARRLQELEAARHPRPTGALTTKDTP